MKKYYNYNWRTRRAVSLNKKKGIQLWEVLFFTFLIGFFVYITYSWTQNAKVESIKKTMIPSVGAKSISVKEYLWLWDCRTVQEEEEHIQKWNGSMYAMDIACKKWHTFDVYAPTWKDVYEVRAISYDDRLGNYIILKHGEYWFVFGHTETLLKVWDRVKAGDEIGMVDKSGMSQNYHLHFELWLNDYNISYRHMYWEKPVYNMEYTYKLRKQRGWYIGEVETMDFIADFEGFRKCAYDDGKQISIGYGTISYWGECITKEEAKLRKLEEIERLMEEVYKNHFVTYHNQRQALVSAMYNLGINSSITKVTERKTEKGIREWFWKFVKSDICNWVCKGLVKRRDIEADLYLWEKQL